MIAYLALALLIPAALAALGTAVYLMDRDYHRQGHCSCRPGECKHRPAKGPESDSAALTTRPAPITPGTISHAL